MKPMCTSGLSTSCKSVPYWLSTWLKQQPLTCSSLAWVRNRPSQISYHLYVPILHAFYTYVIYMCVIRRPSHKWSNGFSCGADAAGCMRTRRVWFVEVVKTWVERWQTFFFFFFLDFRLVEIDVWVWKHWLAPNRVPKGEQMVKKKKN